MSALMKLHRSITSFDEGRLGAEPYDLVKLTPAAPRGSQQMRGPLEPDAGYAQKPR